MTHLGGVVYLAHEGNSRLVGATGPENQQVGLGCHLADCRPGVEQDIEPFPRLVPAEERDARRLASGFDPVGAQIDGIWYHANIAGNRCHRLSRDRTYGGSH